MSTDVAPPVNRREQHKRETRAALEREALRLFAEKGYEQTTVEQIAEAAQVAVRTFFRYFPSKQYVLFGDLVQNRIATVRAELPHRPADEPLLASARWVLEAMDVPDRAAQEQLLGRLRLMERQPALVAIYLQLGQELRGTLAGFVAQRSGLDPHQDPYPLLVASAVTAAWDVSQRVWAATDGRRSLRAVRREIFETLTAGISEPRRAIAGGRIGRTVSGSG